MAIVPLFSESTVNLKEALGLSDNSKPTKGSKLLDQGISEAKNRIYMEFGITEINTLTALATEENPTTENGHKKHTAILLEIKLVKQSMMRSAGSLIADGDHSLQEEWNETSLFRGLNSFEIRDELIRLDRDIGNLIKTLKGLVSAGDNIQGNYTNIAPDEKPFPVGSSIKPLTSSQYDAWKQA
jgi:hypothetical protein|tara:strand:+ start:22057 stop:22608 length:552 start_codon:yes stop_codon:yes gene_type:complete